MGPGDLKGVGRGWRPAAGPFRADVAWDGEAESLSPKEEDSLQAQDSRGPRPSPAHGPALL